VKPVPVEETKSKKNVILVVTHAGGLAYFDKFKKFMKKDPTIKAALGDDWKMKVTDTDLFEAGQKVDTYAAVLFITKYTYLTEGQAMVDHYSAAPVVYFCDRCYASWYGEETYEEWRDLARRDQLAGHTSAKVEYYEKHERSEKFAAAITWCKEQYAEVLKNDVKPAFAKFDKDGSGAIDKTELSQLMADLGFKADDWAVDEALKDLDLDGNGVIDLEEFKRWYFTGMKQYNGSTKAMLRLGGIGKRMSSIAAEAAEMIGKIKDSETKTSSIKFGFNAPADPKTQIEMNVSIGGEAYKKNESELAQYKDSKCFIGVSPDPKTDSLFELVLDMTSGETAQKG